MMAQGAWNIASFSEAEDLDFVFAPIPSTKHSGVALDLYGIAFAHIWMFIGYTTAIFLAGYANIPPEIEETAKLEGLSNWQRFRHIEVPLLATSFTINITPSTIGTLKTFELPFIMTRGGPDGATRTLSLHIIDSLLPIDALVNNAGVTVTAPFLSMSLENLETMWSVNQRSVFLMEHAVARSMLENGRGGSIVNIASNHAGSTTPGYEMYAGTKAAIVAMTRVMAWSLGKHGIRVNSLSPGLTLTEAIALGLASDPDTEAMFRSWHATGRYNTVEDVAKCAVFLLSDASAALSGSDMLADQGMSALLCAEL